MNCEEGWSEPFSVILKRLAYLNIYNNIIDHYPLIEVTRCLSAQWRNAVYPHGGILFSSKKE